MSELVTIAVITTVPSVLAAWASILAAKRSRVTITQGRRAEDKARVAAANSQVAATQSQIAAQQTAQISNGITDNVSAQLDAIIEMLHDHITDPKLHRE